MRRLRWLVPTLICLLLSGVAWASATSAGADLVVRLNEGQAITRHVTFDGSLSGLALLERSGLRVTTSNGAVCAIEGVGCAAADCFCQCRGTGSCQYWAYWRWTGAGWTMSSQGAGQTTVAPDSLEGWRWGDGPPTTANGRSPSLIDPQRAAYAAADWLRGQQLASGGFDEGAFRVGITLDAVLGAAAADAEPGAWRWPGGSTVLSFLGREAEGYVSRGGVAASGKLLAGVVAAEGNPYQFAGGDLVARVRDAFQGTRFGESNWDQAWAMLGLAASSEPIPAPAVQTLLNDAHTGGGWGYFPGDAPDPDSTGLILQALVAAGAPITHTRILNAVTYLRGAQKNDGGFSAIPDGPTNAPSTAMVVSGLIAIGHNPLAPAWRKGGRSPVDALLTFRSPQGGIQGTSGDNDIQATGQSALALMGKSLPIRDRTVAAERAARWLRTQQQPSGQLGFGAGSTVDALFAIAALGDSPNAWRRPGGQSPLDYLATQALTYTASSAAATGKLIVGLRAVNASTDHFGGVDLVTRLTSYDQGSARYGSATNQAWATLALHILGRDSQAAGAQLRRLQASDGGWSSGFSPASDSNTTALAIQALVAAGEPLTSTAILSATAYLRAQQAPQGGFAYTAPDAPDVNSTAVALQALTALRSDPDSLSWTTRLTATDSITLTARTPVDWLLAQQTTTGAFPFFGSDSDYATLQAIPALLGRPLPVVAWRLYLPLLRQAR